MKSQLPVVRPSRRASLAALAGLVLAAGAEGATTSGFTGISTVRSQAFQNENLILYAPATLDQFGAALAAGDFNGDGADDLATGIPGDDGQVGFEKADMGIVVVRYGIPGSGLAPGLASATPRPHRDR